MGFSLSGKESACQCKIPGFDPWVRKIPWRRVWVPTPVFLPGKSHGQRSLVGYSPWGHKRVGHDLVTEQQQQYKITLVLQIEYLLRLLIMAVGVFKLIIVLWAFVVYSVIIYIQ